MKTLIALSVSALISTSAFAQSAPSIDRLYSGAEQISALAARLGLNKVQLTSDSLIRTYKKEVRTSTDRSSTQMGGGVRLSLLLIGAHAHAKYQTESRVDHTQLVEAKVGRTTRDEIRASTDAQKLQAKLNDLLANHLPELIALKEMAALESSIAVQLAAQGESVPWAVVDRAVQLALVTNFDGVHRITRCLTTKHIASFNEEKDSFKAGGGFQFLFISGGANYRQSSMKSEQRYAYNEQQCTSSTESLRADGTSVENAIDLTALDSILETWQVAIERAKAFSSQVEQMPTWGSPYYR